MADECFTQYDRYSQNGGVLPPAKDAEDTDAAAPNLARFHLFDRNGRVKGVYDWEICRYLRETQDYFVLGGVPYLYESGCYRADETGAKLKDIIRSCLYPEFIKSPTIRRVTRRT